MKSLNTTLARLLVAYARGKKASVRQTSEASKGKSKRRKSKALGLLYELSSAWVGEVTVG
jgi:hypothetical protein